MKSIFKKVTFRTIPVYVCVLALLYFSKPEKLYFFIGLIPVVIGEYFRIWGCGHLVKTKELIISGPYAHLRHPLYLGTYLITLGLCMMASRWELLMMAQFVYALYYYPRKEIIEGFRLAGYYGDEYFKYMQAVPALIPSFKAYRQSDQKWSFSRTVGNSELGILFAVIVAVVLLYFKITKLNLPVVIIS